MVLAIDVALAKFEFLLLGRWIVKPAHFRTFLIDSSQLESGEALSEDFRKVAAREIEEFKKEKQARGESIDEITDADLLREVMNTIGRPGRLGADIRCTVSVSMLTKGWDANTVTHIMGVRAFGTQLLCEQVVGRGLRRVSYQVDPKTGFFPVEYAEVLGVPFSFARGGGHASLAGWQWLFIIEGLPSATLGIWTMFALADTPHKASWLSRRERQLVMKRVKVEVREREVSHIWKSMAERDDEHLLGRHDRDGVLSLPRRAPLLLAEAVHSKGMRRSWLS